jgi:hypothetical protein
MVQVVIHGILMDQNKKDLENSKEEDRINAIRAWILVNLEIADVLLKGKSELKMKKHVSHLNMLSFAAE